MKSFLSAALALFLISSLYAEQSAQVPQVMYEFMGQFYRLQPLMFSTKAFTKKENDAVIRDALANLSKNAGKLPHSSRLSTASFQVTATAMQSHLRELSDAYIAGRKEYARRMLVATMDGCSSCHTQVPGRNLPQWTYRDNELKGSDFDKAEFMFTTRHYKESLEKYAAFIKAFGPKDEVLQLETSLRRMLVVYVRIFHDAEGGIKALEPHMNNKLLPRHVRGDIKGWIAGLQDLKKSPAPNPQKATKQEVEIYAKKAIEPLLKKSGARFQPKSFVSFLAASGLVMDFINTRDEVTPELLHLLARCDAQIAQGFFFSLTDNYLRECIVRFPESPVAKQCFKDFEDSMTNEFTGSRGSDLPDDVQAELKRYKKMLNL